MQALRAEFRSVESAIQHMHSQWVDALCPAPYDDYLSEAELHAMTLAELRRAVAIVTDLWVQCVQQENNESNYCTRFSAWSTDDTAA